MKFEILSYENNILNIKYTTKDNKTDIVSFKIGDTFTVIHDVDLEVSNGDSTILKVWQDLLDLIGFKGRKIDEI
jgi:ssRNA-specific RNase YbeY (16S rRNA maturation enzyme)